MKSLNDGLAQVAGFAKAADKFGAEQHRDSLELAGQWVEKKEMEIAEFIKFAVFIGNVSAISQMLVGQEIISKRDKGKAKGKVDFATLIATPSK